MTFSWDLFKKKQPVYRTISFDGPERVGKSTQIRLLKKHLEKKGKKVLVLHSSVLAGRDVTKLKLTSATKNLAYLPALWDSLLKANKFLSEQPKGVVLFDRHILTHLAFSARYQGTPRPLEQVNSAFTWMCHYNYLNFCTVLITGHRFDGSSVDTTLDGYFRRYGDAVPFTTIPIHSDGRNIKEIHEEIKKALGV